MNPPLEKDIEKKIVAYAKSKGMLAYKFTSPARRAVPDRLFITPDGVCGFLEIKRPPNKPTPLQTRELEKISESGAPASWVDNLGDAIRWFDKLLELKITNKKDWV